MTDSRSPYDFADRLEALRVAYRKRLDSELNELDKLVAQHRANPNSNLLELQSHLHKLAGSAGTFGYDQLGRLARQYEQCISELHSDPTEENIPPPDTSDWLTHLHSALKDDDNRTVTPSVSIKRKKQLADEPHIVLVERDSILAEYTAQQLESFGFHVTCIHDADELGQLNGEPPDLLLVDHRASESQEIKTNAAAFWQQRLAYFKCPVFFTGAEESFQARLNALRSRGSGYFVKPLNIIELTTQIVQLLATKDAEAERVMIVDSDSASAVASRKALEQVGMHVFVLNKPAEILSAVSSFNPELIVMNLNLGDITGTELSALLGQMERWANTPVIYLAAETNSTLRQQAILSSNCTLIEKPVDDALLVGVCRTRVQRSRQLEASRNQDGLTGLLKHASIKDALQTHWEHVQRHPNTYFSVVMLDIDHFKRVNDTYGHAVGDVVIAAVGTLLRQRFRRVDKLGRYGGEEFTLVLVDCVSSDALRMVEELREAFASIQFTANGAEFSCTLSAGIVDNETFPSDPPQVLLERADKALYTAKHNGRNQVSLAQE
ncbi:diguanylate cyclase [Salinispirillum sp. LH 10-3-1]|uniref:diguanylate cyclase n=1 Tax=Salinispirillum sp. LH 10-3-1 TaxID=2952525 RepID=A0AB38YFS0_9GAMM